MLDVIPVVQGVAVDANNQDLLIQSCDFSMILDRLIQQKKWKKKDALAAIDSYKKFLLLQKKYFATHHLVPSKIIDEVWHEHILFTKQYHEDCHLLFGTYLHHQTETEKGKFILSEEENEKWADLTEALYFEEYREYIYGEPLEWPLWIKKVIHCWNILSWKKMMKAFKRVIR